MDATAHDDMKKPTRLATLRRKAGLTQFELAHKAGVSLSTVVKAERGVWIGRGVTALIALALGTTPDKLQS